jgi:hypothetical protein
MNEQAFKIGTLKYEDLKIGLQECVNNNDAEVAHQNADRLLKKVALHTGLSKAQREELVNLYSKVRKWYA